ncbi:MAG: PAS domain-containing protein [Pseudomonadota bacterium]
MDSDRPHLSLLKQVDGFPDIVELVTASIASQTQTDVQIKDEALQAVVSIVPQIQANGDVTGAVILIVDNTAELVRTRRELQLIFDNIPQAIFVREVDGTILKANPAASAIVDAGERELTGRNYFEFLSSGSAHTSKQKDESFFKSDEELSDSVGEIENKSGRKLWKRVTRIRSEDVETGEPLLYTMGEDVTQEYESAAALKLSETRLDMAVRAAAVGLWDFAVSTGGLWWSDRFKEIVGVNDETFKGRLEDFSERLHPDDKERIMTAVQRHLTDKEPYDVRYRLRHESGHYVTIDAKGQAIWDDDGEAVSMIGTVEDVTERDRQFTALAESKAQLDSAAKLSGMGYWRIDLINNTLFWSDHIYVIHGVDPKEYTPELQAGINFYHPDDRKEVTEHVNRAIEAGDGFDFEARLVRPDGDVRVVKSIGRTSTNEDGQSDAVFGVFVDVTDDRHRELELRETMQELSKSNEELNRFSYVCSHDMKEPVRLIQSLCELLLVPDVSADNAKRDDLINRIAVNTDRLAAIISSLLAYSRIDERVEHTDVDLNKVAADVTEGLALAIEEANATVELSALPTVTGATVHFSQLLQNLIANALKFNDKPEPIIRISATQSDTTSVEIRVEDNGPGIKPADREAVFGVFQRLQRRDEIEGTGLGLSICQRIVAQYGGSLEIADSLDLGGACFILRLSTDR